MTLTWLFLSTNIVNNFNCIKKYIIKVDNFGLKCSGSDFRFPSHPLRSHLIVYYSIWPSDLNLSHWMPLDHFYFLKVFRFHENDFVFTENGEVSSKTSSQMACLWPSWQWKMLITYAIIFLWVWNESNKTPVVMDGHSWLTAAGFGCSRC